MSNGSGGSMSPMKNSSKTGGSGGTNRLSRIVELMMDKCCPSNLAVSEGIGADNMTCMIIEFIKDKEE